MLIQIKNLRRYFYNEDVVTKALEEVSFNIQKGEFVAIMGSSGSGKSTLMHILGFLDRHTKGEYKYKNKNVAHYSDDQLSHLRNEEIGFVFQSFNLLKKTSVFDNVMLPLIYSEKIKHRENRKKKVLEIIDSVGLNHRLEHLSNQLSGGEKQRVAIARALVNNPQVLLADEPTGNLDSKTGLQIMKLLQNLNGQGKTVILVTHETYTAEHAKRIIRLKDGKVISDEKVKNHKRAQNIKILK